VTRDALVDQLQHFAYYGIGTTMSLGQDTGDEVYKVRAETVPNAARYHTAGRGLTSPEPGRSQAPYWVSMNSNDEKRQCGVHLTQARCIFKWLLGGCSLSGTLHSAQSANAMQRHLTESENSRA
jgi:hypothetical protein